MYINNYRGWLSRCEVDHQHHVVARPEGYIYLDLLTIRRPGEKLGGGQHACNRLYVFEVVASVCHGFTAFLLQYFASVFR